MPAVAPGMDTVVVRGTVRDQAGQPLWGVNVLAMGTPHRATTDEQGQYVLRIDLPAARPERLEVFFSRVGYQAVETEVGGDTTGEIRVDAVLNAAAIELIGIVGEPQRPSLWRRILNAIRSIF